MEEKSNKKVKKATKKLVKNSYPLIKDVSIGGKIVKKGKKVSLTDEGRKYFKSLNYI